MTTEQDGAGLGVLVAAGRDPAVLTVDGELDSFSAGKLRATIGTVVGRQATIIDIRQVPFVDSAGLGALVGGIRRLHEAGGSVVVCCSRPSVLALLRMTGFDRIVVITETPAEAREVLVDTLLPA